MTRGLREALIFDGHKTIAKRGRPRTYELKSLNFHSLMLSPSEASTSGSVSPEPGQYAEDYRRAAGYDPYPAALL